MKTLDGLVIEHVNALLQPLTLDGARRAEVDAQWRAQYAPPKQNRSQKRRERLEAIITRARQRIDVATDRFLDGGLPKDEYDRAVTRYAREIEDTEAQLAALVTPARPALDGIASNLTGVLRMLDDLARGFASEETAERRDVLRELIVKVEPTRLRYGEYRLKITWSPLGESLVWLAERCAELIQYGLEGPPDAAAVTQEAVA
jgi:hypothetical protein